MNDIEVAQILLDRYKLDPNFKDLINRYKDISRSDWFIKAYKGKSRGEIIYIEGDE
jgi:hypothetical protein